MPFDIVLFGGTGDLALRKLLPALHALQREGALAPEANIVAVSQAPLDDEGYRALVGAEAAQPVAAGDRDPRAWRDFVARLRYVRVDGTQAADFARLSALLPEQAARPRVYYLATPPPLFTPICRHLAAAGLATPGARVVLEKPIGSDLASSRRINDAVGSIFREEQIYRIDHYVGKETVQNLLALRFGNTLFEPLWSRAWISHVQITIAENAGVGGRGEFYDATGAVRDMVQNHLLQCLCIVAMEPPCSIDAEAVRDAKLQVLRALRPLGLAEVRSRAVRGQYRAGAIDGQPVAGFLEERGVAPASRTETFAAIKAEVGNWRWAGVPFYLRTGKRMPERLAEIVVSFRSVPHSIFASSAAAAHNRLVIRLQPDEGLTLQLQAKTPGDSMKLNPVALDLAPNGSRHTRRLEAYERLLMDVVRGRLALFVSRQELEAAWAWIEPILAGWEAIDEAPKPYTAGSWGPAASSSLIGSDGCAWREEA